MACKSFSSISRTSRRIPRRSSVGDGGRCAHTTCYIAAICAHCRNPASRALGASFGIRDYAFRAMVGLVASFAQSDGARAWRTFGDFRKKYLSRFFPAIISSVFVLITAGCVGTYTSERASVPNAAFRLQAAQVVWIDNPHLRYHLTKVGYGYGEPVIDEKDKLAGRKVIGQLLTLFRSEIAGTIQSKLVEREVAAGQGITLELTPVGAKYHLNGERGLDVRVTMTQERQPRILWSVTIKTSGLPRYGDSVLLENYISALMKELTDAGWILQKVDSALR